MVQEISRFTAAEGPPVWLQFLLGTAVSRVTAAPAIDLQDVLCVATVLGVGIGAFTLLPLSLRQNRRPNARVITFDGYHAVSALLGRSRDLPTCGFPPH